MFGVIAAGIALGAIVFLFMDIEVVVKYREGQEENGVFLEIIYFNGWFKREYGYKNLNFRLGRLLPFVSLEKEVEQEAGAEIWGRSLRVGLEEALKHWRNMVSFKRGLDHHPSLKRFYFNTIEIKDFKWETGVGNQDAMQTGLLAGGLWAVKGMVLAYVGNKFVLRNATINVVPYFNREVFATNFNCLFRIKMIHVFITTLMVRWFKRLNKNN